MGKVVVGQPLTNILRQQQHLIRGVWAKPRRHVFPPLQDCFELYAGFMTMKVILLYIIVFMRIIFHYFMDVQFGIRLKDESVEHPTVQFLYNCPPITNANSCPLVSAAQTPRVVSRLFSNIFPAFITHDFDLLHRNDKYVELIKGVKVAKLSSMYACAKHPRCLHLQFTPSNVRTVNLVQRSFVEQRRHTKVTPNLW